MFHIFLSYDSADREFVDKLKDDLRAAGIKVWIDNENICIGDSLFDSIVRGINKSQYLGIVLSKNSLNSKWVEKELDIAKDLEAKKKKINVLPLLLDDSEIPWYLKGTLCANFKDQLAYNEQLQKLIA